METSLTKGDKFITLFIAKYNFKTKKLKYINAGHNPPILYKTLEKELGNEDPAPLPKNVAGLKNDEQ